MKETLLKICKAVSQIAIEKVRDGMLRREDCHYLGRLYDYQEGNLSGVQEEITRSIWDPIAIDAIADSVKAQFVEGIEEVITEISQAGVRDSATLRGDLNIFLRLIVKQAADSESAEGVEQIVERFLNEAKGGEIRWQGRIWLDGIRVECDPVQLGDGLVLRSPISADFDEVRPTSFGFGIEMLPMPSAVIECERLSRDQPDIRREINALSLFRLGAVEIVRESWTCDSFFPGKGGVQFPHRCLMQSPYEYSVTSQDQENLRDFIKAVAYKLPTKPRGQHKDSRWTPLKYYFKALQTATEPLERLAEGVACLEAALLIGIKGEITYRLRQRVANFLSFIGFNALAIFDDMKKAYDYRSKYAHGENITNSYTKNIDGVCRKTMEYARLIVLKLLQFDDENERKQILDDLDKSLLDCDRRRQLGTKLRGGLWDLVHREELQ